MLYRQSLLRQLQREKLRRSGSRNAPVFDPAPQTKGWQRAAVLDVSRWQSWPAGRGAGKTRGAALALLKAATSQPRVRVYYVSTSIKRAVATVWDDLVQLAQDAGLGAVANLTTHTLRFPNGSLLTVTGVENRKMANDLRGRQRCALWFLDECQDWADDLLRYFYESVIYPRLGDVQGGVIFAGTGGPPRGYWYSRTKDATYSQHCATAFDNPVAPPGEIQALVEKACQDRGVDVSDPSIQREFFARFVADERRQIFAFDAAKNLYDPAKLPTAGKWYYALGADFGSIDATAVAVWGWTDASPDLYLIESTKLQEKGGTGSSAQVAFVKAAIDRYRQKGSLIGIVGDPGGGGKGHIVDLQNQHGMWMDVAQKDRKASACIRLRDALRTGRIKLPGTIDDNGQLVASQDVRDFVDDLQTPEWDPDAIEKVIKNHFPDRIDAALYSFRATRFYDHQPEAPKKTAQQLEQEAIAALNNPTGGLLDELLS